MSNENLMKQLLAEAERICVIGSPSSTDEITLDILGNAVTKKLVGELAFFSYLQDNSTHFALGQITQVTLRNMWHEDPTMRSLIRQHGRVDAVSERQDTHQGRMTISAVFSHDGKNYRPAILGTVPPTGTSTHVVDNKFLKEVLSPYQKQLFYLGQVYGSESKLPLWFKHFDSGEAGAGEAYHIGVFGKTGSGKSVLARMMLLGYAKHKGMGILILDPQGEFTKGLRHEEEPKSMGQLLCPTMLQGLGKDHKYYTLSNIQLDRWEIFAELLKELGFFSDLGIKNTNYQDLAADYVLDLIRDKGKYKFYDLGQQGVTVLDTILNHLRDNIHRIYAQGTGIDRVQGFIDEIRAALHADQDHRAIKIWATVSQFFISGPGKRSVSDIVKEVVKTKSDGSRPLISVDIARRPADIEVSEAVWNEKIKPLLIDRFISELLHSAEGAFDAETSLNTLVVLDEAHRLAPQGRIENERLARIRSNLIDAVRTTRKYGLGWMFLSQTLSSLDDEIVQQLRVSFFGFGLSMGSEYQKLRELVGGQKDSLSLYQRFRDPQSAFDSTSREYSFMTVGPVSPLSFSGTPLFLNVFNDVSKFIAANSISYQKRLL